MTRIKTVKSRLMSATLAVTMLLSLIRLLPLVVFADDTEYTVFDDGAILLDEKFSGKNVLIKNGVFSVTVSGAQNVNIMFDSVTIDRRFSTNEGTVSVSQDVQNGKTVEGLYYVAQALGWGTATGGYYAQVCPLLITNNSSAIVAFRGVNNLYAGTNRCTVNSSDQYTSVQTGGGFAGIQVDIGSTLTIAPSTGVINAYGAFHVPGDNSENSSYKYSSPQGTVHNQLAGGAGIGGGALWNTTNCGSSSYTGGTPGTIIINGGNINAFGGHEAAGIGGGMNGAATATSITINGGTINAYGGRWAAGIGDGDSLQENWSNKFTDSYKIVINGGTVNATGGVACPAIGTTDAISNLSRKGTSGLEITINGGAVTARSGYPDGFNPKGATGYSGFDAAAAIGAGNNTEMSPASITIGSDAKVIASGFGNYSITEHGTANGGTDKEKVKLPNVKIAPDCYMYLARFPSLISSAERTFKLYLPIETEFNGYIYTKYVTQEKDGSAGKEFYFNAEAVPALLNRKGEEITNDDGTPLTMAEILDRIERNHLVLDVTEDSKEVRRVTAPAFFRSIAMTLPHPQEYGGIYALQVPTGSLNYTPGDDGYQLPESGYIVVDITARAHGTISGEFSYPSRGNLLLDLISDPLEDMDIYPDSAHTDGSDGLIGDAFLNSVYAYNVYIDHSANTAYLYLSYRKLDGITNELVADDVLDLKSEERDGYIYVTGRVDMTGLKQKIIYIMKTDSGNYDGEEKQLNSVVYKIMIAKKAVYTIDLDNPGKIYDGTAIVTRINELYSGEKTYAVYHSVIGTMIEYESGSFIYTLPKTVFDDVRSTYGVKLDDGSDSILSITSSCTVTVSDGILYYNLMITVDAAESSSGALSIAGKQVRFAFSVLPREGEKPFVANTSLEKEVAIAYTDASDTEKAFYLRSDDYGRVTVDYMGKNSLPLFSLFGDTAVTAVNSTDSAARDDAEKNAKSALDAGATSGSWSYEITQARTVTGDQTASVSVCTYFPATGSNTVQEYASYTSSYKRSYTHTENGRYHISAATGGNYTVFAPTAEELSSVKYTYYRSDDNGNTWEALAGAPKNAGYYKVVAEIAAGTYYASGEKIFEIHKRTLTVTRIQNAMTYVSAVEYTFWKAPHAIDQPGAVYLDNLVAGDNIVAIANSVYYNNIDIGYSTGKITLEGVTLIGDADVIANYRIASTQHVFGQITYSLNGSIFRKEPGKPWDKFYPVDSLVPIDRDSADYHSPANADGVYNAHSDYVYARTEGSGNEKRIYAVDIEFGSMNFTYSLTVWNVDTLQYEQLSGESRWSGFDGQTNAITVRNRSNATISYTANSQIDFLHSAIGDTDHGIRSGMYAENNRSSELITGKLQSVPAATPGDSRSFGTPGVGKCFLILSGVPQFNESERYVAVGKVTVTITTSSG